MSPQLESNVIESFKLVKSDVIQLQSLIIKLSENQESLLKQLMDTREKEIALYHQVKNVHTPKMEFVASKKSTKFHASNCIFARNIKFRKTFASATKAQEEGYKSCVCVKN